MKKKKNKLIPGIFIFALLAGAAAYGVWAGNQTEETASVQTATVTIGSLSSTLGSSGNSRSSQSANITWSTTGKVGEVSLQAGDQVQEDQVLAALDPNTLSSDIAYAKLDLINAQEALDDLLNSKLQQA